MFKDMNKLEKAGLIIGAIECIAGFGIAIYNWNKLLKIADDKIQNIEDTTPNVEDIMKQHLNVVEELNKED